MEKDLWKKILISLEANRESRAPGEYCGHGENENLLDDRLWEYAEGLMEEEEEEEIWKQVSGCSYCLTKLISIQQALSAAQAEEGYSYEQVLEILREKGLAAVPGNALPAKEKERKRRSASRARDYLLRPLSAFLKSLYHPLPAYALAGVLLLLLAASLFTRESVVNYPGPAPLSTQGGATFGFSPQISGSLEMRVEEGWFSSHLAFHWGKVKGLYGSYRLILVDVNSKGKPDEVISVDLAGQSFSCPKEKLQRGHRYEWEISGRLEDGSSFSARSGFILRD